MLDTLGPTAVAQRPWLTQSGKAQVDRMLEAYLELRDEFIISFNGPLHTTLDSIKNKAARLAALAMVLADTAQERLTKDITGNAQVEVPTGAPPPRQVRPPAGAPPTLPETRPAGGR